MTDAATVAEAAIKVIETVGHALVEVARQLRMMQQGKTANVNLRFIVDG